MSRIPRVYYATSHLKFPLRTPWRLDVGYTELSQEFDCASPNSESLPLRMASGSWAAIRSIRSVKVHARFRLGRFAHRPPHSQSKGIAPHPRNARFFVKSRTAFVSSRLHNLNVKNSGADLQIISIPRRTMEIDDPPPKVLHARPDPQRHPCHLQRGPPQSPCLGRPERRLPFRSLISIARTPAQQPQRRTHRSRNSGAQQTPPPSPPGSASIPA